MDLFKPTEDGRFELRVPLMKYDERTGEFEGWATIEELDKSGEIIDIERSWPEFQKWSEKFAKATDGESFGNVREQHDPKKAAGKLTAIERRQMDGKDAIFVAGKAVDKGSREKLLERVLVGLSIGGEYIEKSPADDIKKGAVRYVARPTEISLVDNPCVENALITVVKADGSQSIAKAVGFNPPQGFLCRGEIFHVKKDDARKCEEHVRKDEFTGPDASGDASDDVVDDRIASGDSNRAENDKKKKKAKKPAADDAGLKSSDAGDMKKSLYGLSRLACILADLMSARGDAEFDAVWEMLEGEQSNTDVVDRLTEAAQAVFDALEAIIADERAELAEPSSSSTGNAVIEAVTDYAPVFEMSALVSGLTKSASAKQLIKSLRVHTGNGSSDTSQTPKEEIMDKTEKKDEPKVEKTEAPKDGELSKAATDQIAKAVSDGVTKALEPVNAKLGDIEKAQTKASGDFETLKKEFDAAKGVIKAISDKIVTTPAQSKAVKRVTKAEDGKDENVDHSKTEKSDKPATALEKMTAVLTGPPVEVAFGYQKGL
jgi:hypothetical protein